jgi:uncharacterized protein (DUF427 family)
MWEYTGQKRPPFAEKPAKGQESVWDYPRPPVLAAEKRRVEVRLGDVVIADTQRAIRLLETASPPTVYIPSDDVRQDVLALHPSSSYCEWKGDAQYWALKRGNGAREMVGWSYPKPLPGFEAIAGYLSFYPSRVECYVDGERVRPQPGEFYGGWVTKEIVGPFKGGPGTNDW